MIARARTALLGLGYFYLVFGGGFFAGCIYGALVAQHALGP
jgi:hypothetical protein